MTRRIIVFLLGHILRVFYRRVEVQGLEHVPPAPRPAIFVLNHPNALVDPLFILCIAPRRVSVLAKAPIFKMPFLGFLARALECLPVYRHQDDGEDPRKNLETFDSAQRLLARGGTVAIFPEGTTHSEPELKPIKSGAARIALSARAGLDSLAVVQAGLYYTEKQTFRSKALIRYGPPIEVAPPANAAEDPPREAVRELSRRIDEALRAVTLNAAEAEVLDLAARADRILRAEDGLPPAGPAGGGAVAAELDLRRRLIEGRAFFREREPERVAALERRIVRYEDEVEAAGLDPVTLRADFSAGAVAWIALRRLALLLVILPIAAAGAAVHWPAYRLAGALADRFSNDEDVMLATIKVLAAMLLFPLTWTALFVALLYGAGVRPEIATPIAFGAAPAAGRVAVRFAEILGRALRASRAFFAYVARPRFLAMLLAERRAIRDEIVAFGEALDRERARGPA